MPDLKRLLAASVLLLLIACLAPAATVDFDPGSPVAILTKSGTRVVATGDFASGFGDKSVTGVTFFMLNEATDDLYWEDASISGTTWGCTLTDVPAGRYLAWARVSFVDAYDDVCWWECTAVEVVVP